jgi:hypothetical protein
VSDLGSLSGCMLENDTDARRRARKSRQKALVASIVFEAALLGAMLVWPLITPGVLPGRFNVTPAPPYHGGGNAVDRRPPSNVRSPATATNRPPIGLLCTPPVVPNGVRAMNHAAASATLDNAPGIGEGGIHGPPGDGDHQVRSSAVRFIRPAAGANLARRTAGAAIGAIITLNTTNQNGSSAAHCAKTPAVVSKPNISSQRWRWSNKRFRHPARAR